MFNGTLLHYAWFPGLCNPSNGTFPHPRVCRTVYVMQVSAGFDDVAFDPELMQGAFDELASNHWSVSSRMGRPIDLVGRGIGNLPNGARRYNHWVTINSTTTPSSNTPTSTSTATDTTTTTITTGIITNEGICQS